MSQKIRLALFDKMKTIIRNCFSGIMLLPIIRSICPYSIGKQKERDRAFKNIDVHPCIYNSDGKKVEVIYMEGEHVKYCLTAGRTPHNILWNHSDVSLPIHFYGYADIKIAERDTYAKKKCLYLQESRVIIPRVYEYVEKHQDEIEDCFDFIFTADSPILEKFENALFTPASGLWYGTTKWGGELDENRFQKKDKLCSILASYKCRCELHRLRWDVAMNFENDDRVDTFGTYNGGKMVKPCDTLDRYRYSIVVENQISERYFTEKIMNCFAAMTVPIYIGAKKIDEYFNADGIIQLYEDPSIKAVEQALAQCSENDYRNRLDAIVDNFNRVQNYLCPEDYIYKNYGDKLFF